MRLLASRICAIAVLVVIAPACQVITGLADYEVSDVGGGVCDPLATNDVVPGKPLWVRHLGDSARQGAFSVAVDPAGDIVLSGEMAGSMTIGSETLISVEGSVDGFVIKLDACGGLSWAKTLAGPGYQSVRAMVISPNGDIHLAGAFANTLTLDGLTVTSTGSADLFAAKIDAAGGVLWLKSFGGPAEDIVFDAALHPDGQTLALGVGFTGFVELGDFDLTASALSDAAVVTLDGSGNVNGARSFAGPNHESVSAVAYDAQGGLRVGVNLLGNAIDFGGGPLVTAGAGDFGLASFDASGNLLWGKVFGGAAIDFVADVAMVDSNALFTGLFMGTVAFGATSLDSQPFSSDAFVALFDQAGNDVWAREVGDEGSDGAAAVAIDDGTALVAGTCAVSVTPPSGMPIACVEGDPFLIRVDTQGSYQLATDALYGAGDAKALSVAVSPGGHPVLAGEFAAQLTLGGETLVSRGDTDIFLARFARK